MSTPPYTAAPAQTWAASGAPPSECRNGHKAAAMMVPDTVTCTNGTGGNGRGKWRLPTATVNAIETTYAMTDAAAEPLIPNRRMIKRFRARLTTAATSTIHTWCAVLWTNWNALSKWYAFRPARNDPSATSGIMPDAAA